MTVAEPHGILTAALLRALQDPLTDRDASGTIDLRELVEAVTEEVDSETSGHQTPWLARDKVVGDFALLDLPR